MRITVSNIIKAIDGLPKNCAYEYISAKNKGKVEIISSSQENPISIRRFNPVKNKTLKSSKIETISLQMIRRVSNAIEPNVPFNIDRILGASYNTRSVLEMLLAHTPEFYWCLPGRIELANSTSEIKKGHKHLIWLPEHPHENGILKEYKTEQVISEIPTSNAIYESLVIPNSPIHYKLDIDIERRHLQIQVALILIGKQLGFRTWIAHNDKGFRYGDKRIGELDGVVMRLQDEKMLMAYDDAIKAALQIDCIWFKNGKFMPAVMEVEHSTGVTSGLNRMKGLQERLPQYPTRWVIVAPDEDRDMVMRKANEPQFRSLKTLFFPYSAVDELYSLCQRRKLSAAAVNEQFLDCFMEPCNVAIA